MFVIEQRHGFNNTTPGTFVADELKKILVSLVIFAAVLPSLLWSITKTGKALIPMLAGLSIVGIIVVTLLYPSILLPLFYTFHELEDDALKAKIMAEAK